MRNGSLRDTPEIDFADGPLVSIIVPVYNTPEDPLRRCIRSLLALDYENVEFIVVDDGCDEDCVAVLKDALAAETRARIVAGGHKGVSHARNVGIDVARGEWLAFVDSDDEVEHCFVFDALKVALAEGVDLVCGCNTWLFSGDTPDKNRFGGGFFVLDDAGCLEAAGMQMLGNLKFGYPFLPDFGCRTLHAKLFRAECLGALRFHEGVPISEDTLFNYQFIKHCRSIAMVDALWYLYYQYEGSGAHSTDLTLWKKSVDGILESREVGESWVPFFSRCAFMSVQLVWLFAQTLGPLDALVKGKEFISYVGARGCFADECFEGYELTSRLNRYIRLCKRGHYGLACFCEGYRGVVKKLLGLSRARLIDPRDV